LLVEAGDGLLGLLTGRAKPYFKNVETIFAPDALPDVMTLMRSRGMKLSSVSRANFESRPQLALAPHSTVLPQTQAGLAPWSGPRLCPIPTGAWIQMNPGDFDRRSVIADEDEHVRRLEDGAANSTELSKIGAGTRAVNRLWWSLWFLLLPMLWPSSDWVGLIILSQALFVAAKLIKPTNAKTNSATLPDSAVIGLEQGEDCAQG
jgi:hypothetical protein